MSNTSVIIKQKEKEWYQEYLKRIEIYDLSIANLESKLDRVIKLEKEAIDSKNEAELANISDSVRRGKRRLFVAQEKRKYLRPNNWEDVMYRQYQERTFQKRVMEVVPENLLIRFHGAPLWFSKQIIDSKKIVPSYDTYDIKTSSDKEGRISVTQPCNLDRWTTSLYARLFEYKDSLPAGCIFVVFPLTENELDDDTWSMDKIDFNNHPEQLYKIITTPENINLVKSWCKKSGLDTSYVCDYDKFINIIKKDVKKGIFGKQIGLFGKQEPDKIVPETPSEKQNVQSQTITNSSNIVTNTIVQSINQTKENIPIKVDEMSKEQLQYLKDKLTEEYTETTQKGINR